MVYIATAIPSLISPIEDFIIDLSLASSPAIGASMMMKPMIVPSRPSFMTRVAGEGAEAVGAAQAISERAEQQRLIEPPAPLRARFQGKIADVVGDKAIGERGRRVERGDVGASRLDAGRHPLSGIAFARNDDRSPKAMERRSHIDQGDHR